MTDPLKEINDRLGDLIDSPESRQEVLKDFSGTALRLFWHLHLRPSRQSQDLDEVFTGSLVPFLHRQFGHKYEDRLLHQWAMRCADETEQDVLRAISTMPFEDFVNQKLVPDIEPQDLATFMEVWREWKPRVVCLTPRLVSSIRTVDEEYLVWLRQHPDALERIAWEAFEQIIAEIFASKGFHVDLTGRLRNRSADIIAVRADEFGVETKYLIECKKYAHTRLIGLDIVNGVIGAARRADVDHAFLVTSSFFTRDVEAQKQEFKQFRLHLRDGDDVREWLSNYRVRTENGLWLSPGWDEDIEQLHRP